MDSLTKRLQAIRHEVDGSEHPLRGVLMTLLSSLLADVKAMEENYGFPDLTNQNETLKAELEGLKTRHKKELHVLKTNHEGELQRFHAEQKSQLEKLEAVLGGANDKVNRLRAKEAEREKKEAELEPLEAAILRLLGTQDFPVIAEWLADNLGEERVLVKHHLDVLLDGRFVSINANPNRGGGNNLPTWQLEKKGRAYVAKHSLFVATIPKVTLSQATIKAEELSKKGIGAFTTPVKKRLKHASLPELEESVLGVVSSWENDPSGIVKGWPTEFIFSVLRDGGHALTKAKTALILKKLAVSGFVGENCETYGNGSEWYPLEPTAEYLDERGLL